jgi:polyphosphate kinase 2 (PPK2 family)
MFESAELGNRVDDATYAREARKLRPALLDAQYETLEAQSSPIIVLVNGVDGAGKGETVNLLNEWLDPRHVENHAFGPPTDEEAARPPMWRFWRALPPKGKLGVLFGNWYTQPIVERVTGHLDDGDLLVAIDRIRQFEKMLSDEGAVLVKLWFHLSKKAQKKRLRELASSKLTRWRVTKQDWENYSAYDRFARVSENVLRETSSGDAPWVVIEGTDSNYRELTAGRVLLAAMRTRLDTSARASSGATTKKGAPRAAKTTGKPKPTNGNAVAGPKAREVITTPASRVLRSVDASGILRNLRFTERLAKEKYAKRIVQMQGELNKLSRARDMGKHSVVVVFEGMDAAGKGGAIRRVTQALDARQYSVIPIAAPTDEERAHPYLWRFWRHLPAYGRFAIYDRSWYGRVLVERVEGFASDAAWTRAYSEINEFEEQLVESGTVVVKLWLAITKDEQLKRFKERERTKFKQFKITPDDWRNREKWDLYVDAASDMIDRTSTSLAPWTVVEANDKHLARVKVIEAITKRIDARFGR